MIITIVFLSVVAVLIVGVTVMRTLVRALIGATPQPKRIQASTVGPSLVRLTGSRSSRAPVDCWFRFGLGHASIARLGPIVHEDATGVTRRITETTAPIPSGRWSGILTGYPPLSLHPLSCAIAPVEIDSDSRALPAWFVPGESGHWVIHIQGLRTSRAVTLRSMAVSAAAGYPTLSVTFRSAGELPVPGTSTLGQDEWEDVAAAVDYARSSGARSITLVGWSMGAGIALNTARHRQDAVTGLILISPATNWPAIIRDTFSKMRTPQRAATLVRRTLRHPTTARLAGAHRSVNLDALQWTAPGAVAVPTLVIHSRGDETIPFAHSERFAAAHEPLVDLQEFPPSPHGWESNTDPERFTHLILEHLARHASHETPDNEAPSTGAPSEEAGRSTPHPKKN